MLHASCGRGGSLGTLNLDNDSLFDHTGQGISAGAPRGSGGIRLSEEGDLFKVWNGAARVIGNPFADFQAPH